MKPLLCIALVLNVILCTCGLYALGNLRKKADILKYYTFLQNALALPVSLVFSTYLTAAILFDRAVPEWTRGLRYIATCGLMATTLIYAVFLSANGKNQLTPEDFICLNPKTGNFLLHWFCPLVSCLSFVLFERQISLTDSLWTALAPIPSCLYWIVYLILSAAKLWEEPYDFSSRKAGKKTAVPEVLTVTLIPLSFVAVSYVLWQLK